MPALCVFTLARAARPLLLHYEDLRDARNATLQTLVRFLDREPCVANVTQAAMGVSARMWMAQVSPALQTPFLS
jgi:hypothetical protein